MQAGVEETDSRPDVIEVLAADHERIRAGFAELRRVHEVYERRRRFEHLARELSRHETAEEEAVYPVLAQLGEEGARLRARMVDDERSANKLLVRALRLSLLRPGSHRFRKLTEEVADAVEAHASDEERLVFPLLRRTQEHAKLEMMAA